ncbi:MAG: hypothetical protein K0V04_12370 [Deltaproteobacteria bacterium]|nr:hypothetical protein [Deltaproteobacteria bacterium]
MRTDGHGNAVGDSVEPGEAAAIDLAVAALEQLGRVLRLGDLHRIALVFEGGPIAVARSTADSATVTAVGRRGEVPGALLALLRKIENERGTTP